MMSPQAKKATINFSAMLGAALAVMGWAAQRSATALDARYVHVDAFAAAQAGFAKQRAVDSTALASDMRDVRRMLSGLDSSDRCRRGQRDFCR